MTGWRVTWRDWETRPEQVITELGGRTREQIPQRGRWVEHEETLEHGLEAVRLVETLREEGARGVTLYGPHGSRIELS